jgi:cell division protein FtsZ
MFAEQAINSPLLEDINLSGAKGILVNITAGLDLSIGEFDEVGSTVKEFACDDATVVVGTVIEPDMGDELRVTVVATGLGETSVKLQGNPVQEAPPVRLVNSDVVEPGPVDYREMDSPTVVRRDRQTAQSYVDAAKEQDMDYLDIPAFLRRQAD